MTAPSFLTTQAGIRLVIFSCLFITTINVTGQILHDPKRAIFLKETPVQFYLRKDTSLKRFTPTSEEIDSVDTILVQYFLAIDAKDNKHTDIDIYYRQYAGFWINEKKCIFINASCNLPDYFLKNTYHPKGGGRGYFKTLVDLDDKKVLDFYFNAPK